MISLMRGWTSKMLLGIVRNYRSILFAVGIAIICFCAFMTKMGNLEQKQRPASGSKTVGADENGPQEIRERDRSSIEFRFEPGARAFSPSAFAKAELFGLRESDIEQVDDERVLRASPIFVTAFSENHRNEAIDLIETFHARYPNQTLIVYNLGSNENGMHDLTQKYAFLRLESFPFDEYPASVRNLNEYRWKPLIIAQLLAKHDAMWWMDTSVKWSGKADNLKRMFAEIRAGKRFPLQLFDFSTHSNFATTHPGLLQHFPTDEAVLKKTPMYAANVILLFATRHVRRAILRWWIACALEQECMAPPGANLFCSFGADRWQYYANCHRFDQSALNLLTNKAAIADFAGNYTAYTFHESGIEIERF